MKNTTETKDTAPDKFVNVAELLTTLWTKESAPSAGWIYDHVRAGHIPCLKIGAQKYFSVDAVRDAFVRKMKWRANDVSDPKGVIKAAYMHNKAECRRHRELAPFRAAVRAEG